jgi:hypothetical protein
MIQRAAMPLQSNLVIACVDGEPQGGIGTTTMLQQGVRADMAVVTGYLKATFPPVAGDAPRNISVDMTGQPL